MVTKESLARFAYEQFGVPNYNKNLPESLITQLPSREIYQQTKSPSSLSKTIIAHLDQNKKALFRELLCQLALGGLSHPVKWFYYKSKNFLVKFLKVWWTRGELDPCKRLDGVLAQPGGPTH